MGTVLDLTWRLLRGGGRRGMLGSLLTAAAVAVSTGLLLFAVGANHAFGVRADADAWRHPKAAAGAATAVEALSTDHVRGRAVAVVDLAALGGGAPTPPGMPRFPKPGETWASPELAKLMRSLPADQLAGRFPPLAGTLDRDALVHPGELVAVVGRTADDPALTGKRPDDFGLGLTATPTRIAAFQTGAVSPLSETYRLLMLVASVLMVVPLLVFGGAAARLTVARRDQRLAALRLVGATPGQVVAVTVAEAVLTAAAGAVAGAALYGLTVPAVARIEIGGGAWYPADLWPGPLPLLGVLLAVPVLVGISAVVGLRRVVVSPLGVARRETPPRMRAVRAVAFAVILVAFGAVGGSLSGMGRTGITVLLVFLGLAFVGINLVGPWVVALIGRVAVGTARGPVRLLAGRRLLDDPRAAWRTVAGIALTGFVAGFLSLLNPPAADPAARTGRIGLSVPPARVEAVADRARERLAGLLATIRVERPGRAADDVPVVITVTGGPAEVDRARTALTGVLPGRTTATSGDDRSGDALLADVRTGALTVLAVSFLIAITSAGITGASAVLDRRQTYAMLRLAGTPLEVLDRARRQETLIPLAVLGGGSLATGLFFAAPFALGFGAGGALTLLACVVVGVAGIVGASALSRPLLRAVTTDPAPRPD
ncbi:hypothetical protein GCM10009678_33090 [Actinomadura kijaniata]|uniref:FtsX-like permease family protein n=1 Tax=Actinomadura namibiensis TaxID=182080 RepID=A0A7W3LMQ3_ACTNM|nr:ABC transporter permease [Actinomadura namibiensis]MBA8950986.1 hypothetical protein [Actinomadura namibiensis]